MPTDLDRLLAASDGPAFYKSRHPEASRFGSTISPAVRAAFSLFFTHALFRKIKAYGRAQPAIARWRCDLHATILVTLMLLANFIDVLVQGPAGDVASFASIFVMVLPFLKAQAMINLSCGDPDGAGNDRLTKANWAWMIVGALLWVLVIAGLS